jgi:signal transduction histidine kinase/DNA-binding response OmpR family regulator
MTGRAAQGDETPRTVLYIEDNRENRLLVRSVLSSAGYVVREAEDGLAGIEAAIREEPELILLDINLPHIDGYEVAAILKSFPALAQTPIIAVTAYAMEGDRQRTLVAGCDGYISKPIDVDRLPRQVAEFLHGKREQVEEREEGVYLRELNQRLVYRLLDRVEELKQLNGHFTRRASQLEALHEAVSDITSELDVKTLLGRLLPGLARAIGTTSLTVQISEPPGVVVGVGEDADPTAHSVFATKRAGPAGDAAWRLPLAARGRQLGAMIATHTMPTGRRKDEEQLLKIVANHLAIAVENSRLFEAMRKRAAQQESLVEAGRLLASTLDVQEVLDRLAELVRTRLSADVVRIWLRGDRTGEFRLHAQAGGRRMPGTGPSCRLSGGLVGHIMAERKPLAVPELSSDQRLVSSDWITAEQLVSFLGVPLILEGESIGVLCVMTRTPREFSGDEVGFTEALATSAAVAIRNARLYEETQTRLRQNETLLTVGQELGSTLELREVARRTTREMVRALGADLGFAWRLASPANELVPLAGYHVPADLVAAFAETPLVLDDAFIEEAKSGPICVSDSRVSGRFDHPVLQSVPHRAVLVCPMRFKEETFGFFAIVWRDTVHTFSSNEIRLAEGICRLGAMAVENSRLYGELREALQAVEDSQQRAAQAERLRALGEMAGGIAHDFNNVLAIIVGRIEVLLEDIEDPETKRQLEIVANAAFDGTQTVKRIQDFARVRRQRPFQATDLNQLVQEVRELTRSRWKDEADARAVNYELVIEASPLPLVAGDPSEIREALTNILFNALDAMPDGGRVTFTTSVEEGRVCCRIADTGIGMAESVRQRVFDPFFTTKGERGTGLGLSIVYGIVARHGGEVEVESEPGSGAVFTLRLPIAIDVAPEAPASATPTSSSKGRILVVDDERAILDALREVLTRDGHSVVACAGGADALHEIERQPFDLIITDLGMTGVSGWEVARLAKSSTPATPIAMMTGWSDSIEVEQATTRGVDYLIAKPFRLNDIRRVVGGALTRACGATA